MPKKMPDQALKNDFFLIGVANGWGATNTGTYLGPQKILESQDPFSPHPRLFTDFFQQSRYIVPLSQTPQDNFPLMGEGLETRNGHCRDVNQEVYRAVYKGLQEGIGRPFVMGGDQSISIGTWSAVLNYFHQKNKDKPLGLIWIDAHFDAHTPVTSPSQALHGMPAAILMGHGKSGLTDSLLQPDRLVYIGARSYEEGEHDLLKSLGVKIYYQADVDQRGFGLVFQEARDYVTRGDCPYGITLDIDAFDPEEAPGTGARAAHGLKSVDVLPALTNIFEDKKLMAFELVEFNPKLDYEDKTLQLIWKVFHQMNSGRVE